MPNKSCAFYSCKSNSRKDPTLKWTRFVSPYKDLERYKIWFEKLKRPYYNVTRFTYVCEKHFPQGTDLNELTNLELVPEAESNPEECFLQIPSCSCAFFSCNSNSKKDPTLQWAKFVPSTIDQERHEKWFKQLKRPSYPVTKNTYVCQKHFPTNADLKYWTNPDLMPAVETDPEEYEVKILRPRRPHQRSKDDKDEVIVLEEHKIRKVEESKKLNQNTEHTTANIKNIQQISNKVKGKKKKIKWQCECNKSFYSKQSLLNHIMKIHGQKQVSSDKPFQVHLQEDVIVFKVNLCENFKWSVKVNQDQFQENFCKVEVVEHLDSCELPPESILSYDSELEDPLRI